MSRPVTFQYGSNKPFEVYVLKEMNYIGLIELKHTIAQLAGGDGSECFFIKKGDATLPLTAVYEDDGQQPLIVVFNGLFDQGGGTVDNYKADVKWKSDFDLKVANIIQQEQFLDDFPEKPISKVKRKNMYSEWYTNYCNLCDEFFNNFVGSKEMTSRLNRLDIINDYQKYLIDTQVLDGGTRSDGLPDMKLSTQRHYTVRELFKNLNTCKKIQIYAPPGSGKSSLSALLIRYLIIIKKFNVLYIPCCQFLNDRYENGDFFSYLATQLIETYARLLKEPSNDPIKKHEQIVEQIRNFFFATDHVVIIDDAHIIFHAKSFFTFAIKTSTNLLLCLTTQQLDTISYDGSPAEFLHKQSLETLRFNGFEFDELLDKMIRNSRLIVPHFDINPNWFADNVRDEIYSQTGGYACFVFRSISYFFSSILAKTNIKFCDANKLYDEYFGLNVYKFYNVLKSTAASRCFPSIELIISKLAFNLKNLKEFENTTNINNEASIILQRCLDKLIVLHPLTASMFFSDNPFSKSSYEACLNLLLRTCICGKETNKELNEEEYFFWSPIYRKVYTDEYIRVFRSFQTSISRETAENFTSHESSRKALFVKELVSLFNTSLLKGCLTKTASKANKVKTLFEAPYDRFVFLSLRFLGFTSISAQWNQDMKDKGNIDYYVNTEYNVGIEVMQNGNHLLDHLSRSGHDGSYRMIKNYLIIDFRQHQNDETGFSKAKEMLKSKAFVKLGLAKSKYFPIYFSPDFSTGKIFYWDDSDVKDLDFHCTP